MSLPLLSVEDERCSLRRGKKGELKKKLRSHDCKKESLFYFFKFNIPKKYHKASSSASSVSKAMRPGVLKVESNKVFFAGA